MKGVRSKRGGGGIQRIIKDLPKYIDDRDYFDALGGKVPMYKIRQVRKEHGLCIGKGRGKSPYDMAMKVVASTLISDGIINAAVFIRKFLVEYFE